MIAVNHALTGTLIGLAVGQPAIAVPLALASHYICDAIPHYGTAQPDKKVLKSNLFRNYLLIEAALCFLIVLVLAVLQPQYWLLAAVCAFVAAAPDLLSFNKFIRIRHDNQWRPNLYSRFASGIQWFERPIGAVIEITWFASCLLLLNIYV